MNRNQPIKVKIKPFYGLRGASMVFKTLAVLTIIISIGAIGYLGVQFFSNPAPVRVNAPTNGLIDYAYQALGIAAGGGLAALLFYVLAQLIEIQLAMNEKLRQIVKHVSETENAVQGIKTANQLTLDAVQNQSRLLRFQINEQVGDTPQRLSDRE